MIYAKISVYPFRQEGKTSAEESFKKVVVEIIADDSIQGSSASKSDIALKSRLHL